MENLTTQQLKNLEKAAETKSCFTVFSYLLARYRKLGQVHACSLTKISKGTGKAKSTVKFALDRLEKIEVIKCYRRNKRRMSRLNVDSPIFERFVSLLEANWEADLTY